MKTKYLWAFASMLAFAAYGTGNMLVNGDFADTALQPWKSTKKGYKTVHFVKDGKLISVGDPANKYNPGLTLTQDVPVKLIPGKRYLLSVKAKAAVEKHDKKYCSVRIRAIGAHGGSLLYSGLQLDLNLTGWKTYHHIYTPSDKAVAHQIYVDTGNFTGADQVEIDEIILREAPAVKPENGNLILNGNFEYFQLEPWRAPQTGKNNRFYQLSNDTRFGTQCLRICGDQKFRYKNSSFIQSLPKLEPGKEYILSARVRCSDKKSSSGGLKNATDKSVKIHIRQINSANRSLVYTGFPVNLTDDTWKYYEKIIVPHKEAVAFELYISTDGLDVDDLVFVDEIKLRPAGETAAPFDPQAVKNVPVEVMKQDGITAGISKKSGLLHSLTIDGQIIQPGALNSTVVFVEKADQETHLDGKNTPAAGFKADVKYDFADGMFREVVVIEALQDYADPVKLGVRHGFNVKDWQTLLGALRPVRHLPADKATIFSFGGDINDLNPGILDSYQHTAYPLIVLESDKNYLLAGSRNVDDFVTLAPNKPAGYIPSLQRNPKTVKKGDKFRFESNWKLFSREKYMLRDLWRFYQEHLQTADKELAKFIPAKYPEPRHFYPGVFAAHTYLMKSREERTPDGANIWFYAVHDTIRERYPVTGSWWAEGNAYNGKIEAEALKKYVARVQQERDFKLVLYLRQLANLRERDRGAFPDSWYKRSPGGALHLYGGGYEVKLRDHVAKDVGYKTIPWGQHNFANPDFRKFYLNEIYNYIDFLQPRAIGWDMGSDLDEFKVIATTYTHLRDQGHKIKAVANEGAGPTAAYVDMVMLENGILGGKSVYDFEVNRAYTRALVCLERWNIFRLAFDANTTGKKTWLNDNGLKENKRYLDVLLAKYPHLKNDRIEAARLCQLRASIYDLALGASPGYMEEAAPVPPTLVKVAGDVNGLYMINRSFAVMFPNRSNIDGHKIVSGWKNSKSFRLVAFNNQLEAAEFTVLLDKKYFAADNWNTGNLKNAAAKAVSPENERDMTVDISENSDYITLKFKLDGFTALMLSADK